MSNKEWENHFDRPSWNSLPEDVYTSVDEDAKKHGFRPFPLGMYFPPEHGLISSQSKAFNKLIEFAISASNAEKMTHGGKPVCYGSHIHVMTDNSCYITFAIQDHISVFTNTLNTAISLINDEVLTNLGTSHYPTIQAQ